MPLYEYLCSGGHITEGFAPVEHCSLDTVCSLCGERAQRILSVPNITGATKSGNGFERLWVPFGHEKFTSTRQIDAYMKKHGIEKG